MSRRPSLRLLATFGAGLLPALCTAAEAPTVESAFMGGSAGLALLNAPVYAGADESRTRAAPQLDLRWRNGAFLSTADGAGWQFVAGPAIAGLQLTADRGRRERDSERLRGLGDVKARPELGAFVHLPVGDGALLSSSLRHGSGQDRRGLVFTLGAMQALPLGGAWDLSVGLSATYANASHQQAYFGVTPAQAAASGLRAYSAGAGLKSVDTALGVSRPLGERQSVNAGLTLSRLQGDARHSPLVRQRTATGAMVSWSHSL